MTALPARKAPLALKAKIKSFLTFCDTYVAQAQKLSYLSWLEVKSPRNLDYLFNRSEH